MQFSNIIISALVSYVSICDAHYQVTRPTTTAAVPSYPTAAPGYPTKPDTPVGNNDLYFVCKLNDARVQQGLKPLSVVDNYKAIAQQLATKHSQNIAEQSDLFGKFQQAGLSLKGYAEKYFAGFDSLNKVAEAYVSDKKSFLYSADYDVIGFSYNNGVASVILGTANEGNRGYIPVCNGYPTVPQQPQYPTKPEQPQYPTQPEQPQYPTQPEQPQYPTKPEQPQYPTKPEQPSKPSTGVPAGDAGKKCLCLVNAFRAQNGKAPLYWSDKLAAAAQGHSEDMQNGGNLTHDGTNGSKLGDRIKDNGFTWSGAAENIADGQSGYAEAQDGWEKSQYHRDNLLGDYVYFGYGQSSGEHKYYTQNFAAAFGADNEPKVQVQC